MLRRLSTTAFILALMGCGQPADRRGSLDTYNGGNTTNTNSTIPTLSCSTSVSASSVPINQKVQVTLTLSGTAPFTITTSSGATITASTTTKVVQVSYSTVGVHSSVLKFTDAAGKIGKCSFKITTTNP